ncbi:hypothetical protein DAPPUDRAFT_310668 [Daphnia pulex]|uniref:Uncharacterized protein n=1 Tax=Daphnia pulex TaxID=6669 RepID=E9FV36_DAPPU|nr:hypothetical protein DAPPUDRAFT_310668 [Daphnia pulex]|eukprot:EFX88487.1 hypothetical protein DAPPUDRAFT_310668 [Daphnia pulex]
MYSLLIVMFDEVFVENAIIQLFDLSNYSDSLATEAKERYLSKLIKEGIVSAQKDIEATKKELQEA